MSAAEKDPERYWAELEKELGEKILFYTLGQSHTAMASSRDVLPIWGLFYITPTRLFFRHFPKSGKFSFFGFGASATVDNPETFALARESIVRIEIIAEKRWWKRLLSSSLPVIVIEYRMAEGEVEEFRFTLERKQDEFLDLLRLQ